MFKPLALLSPLGSDAGGSAPAAPGPASPAATPAAPAPNPSAPSTPSGTATPPPQPAQQPGGRFVSDTEFATFQRYEQQAKGNQALHTRFKEAGYNDFDSAINDLRSFRQIQSDPSIRGIIDAMNRTAGNPPAQPIAAQPGAPLTVDQINALLDQREQRQAQARLQQEHNAAMAAETQLVNGLINDPVVATFFKGATTFEEALQGKAGPVGAAIAMLVDNQLTNVADRYENGYAKPVTDAARVRQATSAVLEIVKGLKAHALIEASTDQPSLGNPPMRLVTDPPQPNSGEWRQATPEEINADFQANLRYRQGQANGVAHSQAV